MPTWLLNPKVIGGFVGLVLLVVIGFMGYRAFDDYIDKVRGSVVVECNNTKLEEELAKVKAEKEESDRQVAYWQEQANAKEAEVVERIVYRDRVITKIKEVQADLEGEDLIREELSPTTKAFLESMKERQDAE